MNRDHCRWILDRLPLFAGGDLTVEESRRVERHLIGCASCRLRRQSLRQALDVLRTYASQEEEALSQIAAREGSLWPGLSSQIRQSRRRVSWFDWDLPGWLGDRSPLVPGLAAGLVVMTLVAAWAWRERTASERDRADAMARQTPLVRRPALPQGNPVSTAATLTEKPATTELGPTPGAGSRDPQRSY